MPKSDDEAKSAFIGIRLSADELRKLDDICAATRRNRSSVMRKLLGDTRHLMPVPPRKSIWDEKAIVSMNKIGHLLNQIARELHQRERQGVSAEEIASIDKALLKVVMVTMAGPETAQQTMIEGLSSFMERVSIQRQHGPSENP